MTESVVLNEWMDRAAIKSKVEDLVGILEDKFGPLPAETKAQIEAATERDIRRRWVILAAKTISLDQFLRDAGL